MSGCVFSLQQAVAVLLVTRWPHSPCCEVFTPGQSDCLGGLCPARVGICDRRVCDSCTLLGSPKSLLSLWNGITLALCN